jgi:hypothetical protein
MTSTRKHLGTLLLAVTFGFGLTTALMAPRAAVAQAVSGDITGVVTDVNKAVVVQADVVATNEATGVSYCAINNVLG